MSRSALRALEKRYNVYGDGSAGEKAALLERLAGAELASARDVLALHEVLCFLRAYPDDERVLVAVERMLDGFSRRRDLRRFRGELEDSGIAGTVTAFPFFARPALRLAERWGDRIAIDWRSFENASRLERWLPHLALYAERATFDEPALSPRAWLRRFKGEGETDAAFLVRRVHTLAAEEPLLATLYDDLDPPLRLSPGPDTPSRTREKHPGMRVTFQTRPLVRARPDLAAAVKRAPRAVAAVVGSEAEALIELARDTMIPRQRDLEVFAYANPEDVRLVDAGDGLMFACIGVLPERRSLLEAVYAFLMLKNGVAVGYALCTALFRSSEIAYNVFETFRGGETAHMLGRLLATVRHLFGSRTFAIDPHQLGHRNKEGLESGAFWFYAKLGFRPRAPEVLRVLEAEDRAMAREKAHRSSLATLKKLASAYVFWPGDRADVLGVLSVARVSLRVSEMLARRFGVDRARASKVCDKEARARFGVSAVESKRWSPTERQAWERWAPLLAMLDLADGWSREQKLEAVRVVLAKGARSEDEFLARFEAHARLRREIKRFAAPARA